MRNLQEPRDAASGHLDDEGVSECAFSPEQAAPGALEHAAGCPDCTARIEELGRLLASLADLPEPEIPESVLIRLDATVARAWQEADAEARQQLRAKQRRRTRAWRRLAVPATALAVIIGAVVGFASLVHLGGDSASTATSAGAPAAAGRGTTTLPGAKPMGQSQLTEMASEALNPPSASAVQGHGTGVESTPTVTTPGSLGAVATASPKSNAMAACFRAPARAGYTVAAVAPETYSGVEASLIVYRNDEEPASTTTFYAVLYAGSCPDSTSRVLDEGLVSVSR